MSQCTPLSTDRPGLLGHKTTFVTAALNCISLLPRITAPSASSLLLHLPRRAWGGQFYDIALPLQPLFVELLHNPSSSQKPSYGL